MTQDTAHSEQQKLKDWATIPDEKSYRPLIYTHQEEALHLIFKNNRPQFHDEILSQVKGLIKVRHPRLADDKQALDELFQDWLTTHNPAEYGVYVYYPWSNRVVHILPEEEFIELRTARNRHKITQEEQDRLKEKCVGVIGLSVGQTVALTMALERSCGHLKLADFDELELSNLNRIKAGIHNLGLPKTIITAREIAEIDPFLRFELFPQGITEDNIDHFLDGGPAIDLLIEECDDLSVKISARKAARTRGIPVLMDTSDRGMLDVERFDEEPDRPLLHGLVPGLDQINVEDMPFEQRIGVLLKLVGGLSISNRLKASLLELNQSISSWPQLSSSVNLGGGITGDVARKILLGGPVESGRYYADPDQIVKSRPQPEPEYTAPAAISESEMAAIMKKIAGATDEKPTADLIAEAVRMAGEAPSSGNDQPWLFYYFQGVLGVFHNRERAYSFGDYRNYASYQSVGAALENLRLFMLSRGYETSFQYLPEGDHSDLMALASFQKAKSVNSELTGLVEQIEKRSTNREITPRQEVETGLLNMLGQSMAEFNGARIHWITDQDMLRQQGQIIAECDKVRVFDQWGHFDFFNREMRWTPEEAEKRADGIDIRGLGIDPQSMLAIRILSNYDVVSTLSSVGGGQAFDAISVDAAVSASAMGLVTMPELSTESLLKGGQAWERLWLEATRQGLAFHPLVSPLYLFNRAFNGGEKELSEKARITLKEQYPRFEQIWHLGNEQPIFMFRIFYSNIEPVRSMRISTDKILFPNDHKG